MDPFRHAEAVVDLYRRAEKACVRQRIPKSDRDDVIQDAMVRLLKVMHFGLSFVEAVDDSYVAKVVQTARIDRVRKRTRQNRVTNVSTDIVEAAPSPRGTDPSLEHDLRDAVAALSPDDQKLVELIDSGASVEEMTVALGVHARTLHRRRRSLKMKLARILGLKPQ